MRELNNKVAVVTGGHSGIGFATAQRFIADGAQVVVTGRNQKALDAAVAELGDRVTGIRGDVANLDVGEDGTATLTVATNLWSVGTGDDNDVVGRAVIVHAGVDDFTTQPTGAAGGRIGCGVIQAQ